MLRVRFGIFLAISILAIPLPALSAGVIASCDDLVGITAVDPATGASIDAGAYCRLANRAVFPVSPDTAKTDETNLKAAISSQRLTLGIGKRLNSQQLIAQAEAVQAFPTSRVVNSVAKFIVNFGKSKTSASDLANDVRALNMAKATIHDDNPPSPAPSPTSTLPAIDQVIAATFKDFGCYVEHNGTESSCPTPSATPWAAPLATGIPSSSPSPFVVPAHSKPSSAQFQIQPGYSVSTSGGNLTLKLDYSTSVLLPRELRIGGEAPIALGSLETVIVLPKTGAISMSADLKSSKTTSGMLGDSISVGRVNLAGSNLSTVGSSLSQYQDVQFCTGQRRFPIAFIGLSASISCKARYSVTIFADTEPTLGYALFGPSVDVAITGNVVADAVFVSGTLSADIHLVSADARLGVMYGIIGDPAKPELLYNPTIIYDATFGEARFTFTVATLWGKKYDIPLVTTEAFKAKPFVTEPWYATNLNR